MLRVSVVVLRTLLHSRQDTVPTTHQRPAPSTAKAKGRGYRQAAHKATKGRAGILGNQVYGARSAYVARFSIYYHTGLGALTGGGISRVLIRCAA